MSDGFLYFEPMCQMMHLSDDRVQINCSLQTKKIVYDNKTEKIILDDRLI
jgi:hypothetical protein